MVGIPIRDFRPSPKVGFFKTLAHRQMTTRAATDRGHVVTQLVATPEYVECTRGDGDYARRRGWAGRRQRRRRREGRADRRNVNLALRPNALLCKETPAVYLKETFSVPLGSLQRVHFFKRGISYFTAFYQPLHLLMDNFLSLRALKSHFGRFFYAQRETRLF